MCCSGQLKSGALQPLRCSAVLIWQTVSLKWDYVTYERRHNVFLLLTMKRLIYKQQNSRYWVILIFWHEVFYLYMLPCSMKLNRFASKGNSGISEASLFFYEKYNKKVEIWETQIARQEACCVSTNFLQKLQKYCIVVEWEDFSTKNTSAFLNSHKG